MTPSASSVNTIHWAAAASSADRASSGAAISPKNTADREYLRHKHTDKCTQIHTVTVTHTDAPREAYIFVLMQHHATMSACPYVALAWHLTIRYPSSSDGSGIREREKSMLNYTPSRARIQGFRQYIYYRYDV